MERTENATDSNHKRLAKRLRERVLRARNDKARQATRNSDCGTDPGADRRPSPGDLFVFPETAQFSFEWAVLDDAEDHRFLVIAADVSPLTGSSDVAVPRTSRSGSLTLRCGCQAWLDESAFATATRTGALEPEDLARALRKRAEIATDTASGSAFERETDSEPDYLDLQGEIRRARTALLKSPPSTTLKTAANDPGHRLVEPDLRTPTRGLARLRPADSRPSTRQYGDFYRTAASVLLILTLGLLAALSWKQREVSN